MITVSIVDDESQLRQSIVTFINGSAGFRCLSAYGSAEEALARELVEEAGVKITSPPVLVALHVNRTNFRGDHVALFRIEDWTPCEATSVGEIHQVCWFAPDALPAGVTETTRLRIAEAIANRRRREDR